MTPSASKPVPGLVLGQLPRWLRPTLFDLVVVTLPLWFFALADGGTGLLLSDGDTAWHIRTGDWILQHNSFIRNDIFSFSKAGQAWFAWEWLSDIVLSTLHNLCGIKGILLYGITLGTAFFALLLGHLTWRKINVFIALPLALMAFGASTVHLLARPHLFTMLFVAGSMWLIQKDLRTPTGWLWALVPLTALWANLHGGWLAIIVLTGLVSIGSALEAAFGEGHWYTVLRYILLGAGCAAASLLNPYGYELHRHMAEYLSAAWIKDLVGEFKSPEFRSENLAQYELLLLGGVAAAGAQMLRKRFVLPLLTLFWAHNSLVSARHIPLYAAVALPLLGDELQRLWQQWTATARRSSIPGILRSLGEEAQDGLGRASVWLVIPFIIASGPWLPIPWPQQLSTERFPVAMVAAQGDLIAGRRVLAEDQWADYLIYALSPRVRVFFDGRSDFYGEKISRDYCKLLNGGYQARPLLDEHGIDAVLLKPTWGLTSLLKREPGWRLVADDGKALLFVRRGATGG